MNYGLLRTDDAERHVTELFDYIADESGSEETALRVLQRIENAANTLREFPHKGTPLKIRMLGLQGYRMLAVEPYLIFYQCDDRTETVTIVAILHSRMDYENMLQ